jgi:hypothetical protein
VAQYWAFRADADVRAAESRRSTELAALRRAELSQLARPLLAGIAAGRLADPVDDQQFRSACRAVEQQLRDDLRAREMLDDTVRRSVLEARRRGVRISLRDDRSGSPEAVAHTLVPSRLRTFVAGAIDGVDRGEVTVRIPSVGPRLTLAVVSPTAGHSRATRTADRLAALADRLELRLTVDAVDCDVFAVVEAAPGQVRAESSI